jgi:hypothetical protein
MHAALSSPRFRLELSRALLHRHWGLRLPAFDPQQNLCPPVPNRYFFVSWLKGTVLSGERRWFHGGGGGDDDGNATRANREPIRVLDIGTGASAIYALLWAADAGTAGQGSGDAAEESQLATTTTEIYATDVDEESVRAAACNAAANQPRLWAEKRAKVHVLKVDPTDRQQQQVLSSHLQGSVEGPDGNEEEIPKGPLRRSLEAVAAFSARDPGGVAGPPAATASRLDACLTNPPFFDLGEEPGPRADGQDRAAMTHHEGANPSCAVVAARRFFFFRALPSSALRLFEQEATPAASLGLLWT